MYKYFIFAINGDETLYFTGFIRGLVSDMPSWSDDRAKALMMSEQEASDQAYPGSKLALKGWTLGCGSVN